MPSGRPHEIEFRVPLLVLCRLSSLSGLPPSGCYVTQDKEPFGTHWENPERKSADIACRRDL